jgi:hypothetical protein
MMLLVAWAYVTTLMVSSSWGQIQDTLQGHPEPENAEIVIGKLVILTICIVSLALSFSTRRATVDAAVHSFVPRRDSMIARHARVKRCRTGL